MLWKHQPWLPQGRLAQATGIDLFGVETIGFSVEVLLSSAGIQLSKWVISSSKNSFEGVLKMGDPKIIPILWHKVGRVLTCLAFQL